MRGSPLDEAHAETGGVGVTAVSFLCIQLSVGSEEASMTQRNAAKWFVPVGLAISLVFTGACGGASESADQTSSTATTAEADEPANSEAAMAMTVEIIEFAYSPKQITVKVGDTVSWVNRDAFLHTVTSGAVDGPENIADDKFDEDLDEAGSEASVTFDEAGTFTYFCKQHNAMDGVVIVE